MRYCLLITALLITFRGFAQLSVGSDGIALIAGTSFSIDGLGLTPSSNLILANNSIQRTSTPVAGSPNGAISRFYLFGSPITFSGVASIYYLPSELNDHTEETLQLAYSSTSNGPFTRTTGSTVDATNHFVTNSFTNTNLFVVTADAPADITPILYALPSTQYGITNFSVVADIFEVNATTTSSPITVLITKDSHVDLNFNATATFVGGRPVDNSSWTFDGSSNDNFYILRTTLAVVGGDRKSFGLTGILTPGNTRGTLTLTTTVAGLAEGEVKITNNTDSDRIDYFNK